MENQKSNKGLYIIISVLSVLVLLLGSYIIYDKVFNNEENPINDNTNNLSDNNDIKENNSNNETTEFSLEQLKGVWGNCRLNELNNRICYVTEIQEQNGKYIYQAGQYQTGGGATSEITKLDKLNENKYQIEIYNAGYNGPAGSSPESRLTKTIDISDINNKIIYIDENKYEYVTENMSNTGDLTQFFEQ